MSSPARIDGTLPRRRVSGQNGTDIAPTCPDWKTSVEELAEDYAREMGGSKLAAYQLGTSYRQFRKYLSNGAIPSVDRVLAMCRGVGSKHRFRRALLAELKHMFDPPALTPDEVAARVEAQLRGKPYARAAAEAARQACLPGCEDIRRTKR